MINIKKYSSRGFTLIELMVTVAVLVILLTIGVPSMTNWIDSNRATATANNIVGGLQYARSEAVRLNQDMTFTLTGNNWTVVNGGTVLREGQIRNGVTVSNAGARVFNSAGALTASSSPIAVNSGSAARCVRIMRGGKASVELGGCS